MILRITSELQRKIKILTRKIPNPKKTFGLVLMFALVGMVHLYIQQKDTRITELQNELRLVSYHRDQKSTDRSIQPPHLENRLL